MTQFSPWLASHVETIMLWTGAICTIALFSILYKENKVYRVFEHIFLGLGTGYMVSTNWNDIIYPKLWVPLWDKGEWWLVFVLFAGLFYYFIYSNKFNWLARLVIGFFLGVTSGRAFQEFVNDIWPQVATSFKPLIPHAAVAGPTAGKALVKELTTSGAINNLIFLVILLCVMTYFFFSFEQRHPVIKGASKWGRWLMMFTFGAIFGSTIMGRLALLIDRVDFLLNDFGPQVGGKGVMFALLMGAAVLIVYLVSKSKGQAPEYES